MTEILEALPGGLIKAVLNASLLHAEKLQLLDSIEQVGYLNVKTGDIHMSMIAPNSSIGSASETQNEPTHRQGSLNQSTHIGLLAGDNQSPTINRLPSPPGIYVQFNDVDWWESTPEYLDIIPKLRFCPIVNSTQRFPSVEENEFGAKRPITVTRTQNSLSVKRDVDQLKIAGNVPASPDLAKCKRARSWSLQYVFPNTIMRYSSQRIQIAWEYSENFAQSMWLLKNDHDGRGEEGYIIAVKDSSNRTKSINE